MEVSRVHWLALLKNVGVPIPKKRFIVFQVHPAGRYQQEFWSLDVFEEAQTLCEDLTKKGRRAYVFDVLTQKRVFELGARGYTA